MNTMEKELANEAVFALWKKFTLQPLSLELDFFESGGDSLSAINMIVEIQKIYDLEISLEGFMRNPCLDFILGLTKNAKARIE